MDVRWWGDRSRFGDRDAANREARGYPEGRYDLLVVGTKRSSRSLDVTTDRQPISSPRRGHRRRVGDEDGRAAGEHGDTPLRPLLELLQRGRARRPTR